MANIGVCEAKNGPGHSSVIKQIFTPIGVTVADILLLLLLLLLLL